LQGEAKLKKIPQQECTPEFRELAAKRLKAGQTAVAVAKELGPIKHTLCNLVKAFDAGKLNGPGTKPLVSEQMEFSRVRAENLRLKRENEILK
jgi:transposase